MRKESAIAFLIAAVDYYQGLGIAITRVMAGNGACYISKAFAATRGQLGLKHVRTKPYTPRTNAIAERFIQTAIREWACTSAYKASDQRAEYLQSWTHMYNWHRPHGGIKDRTPISRLGLDRTT